MYRDEFTLDCRDCKTRGTAPRSHDDVHDVAVGIRSRHRVSGDANQCRCLLEGDPICTYLLPVSAEDTLVSKLVVCLQLAALPKLGGRHKDRRLAEAAPLRATADTQPLLRHHRLQLDRRRCTGRYQARGRSNVALENLHIRTFRK